MKIGIVQRASSYLGLLGGRQMVTEAVVAEFNVAEKRWMARCLHPKCNVFPVIPFLNFEPWISGRRPPGFFSGWDLSIRAIFLLFLQTQGDEAALGLLKVGSRF